MSGGGRELAGGSDNKTPEGVCWLHDTGEIRLEGVVGTVEDTYTTENAPPMVVPNRQRRCRSGYSRQSRDRVCHQHRR